MLEEIAWHKSHQMIKPLGAEEFQCFICKLYESDGDIIYACLKQVHPLRADCVKTVIRVMPYEVINEQDIGEIDDNDRADAPAKSPLFSARTAEGLHWSEEYARYRSRWIGVAAKVYDDSVVENEYVRRTMCDDLERVEQQLCYWDMKRFATGKISNEEAKHMAIFLNRKMKLIQALGLDKKKDNRPSMAELLEAMQGEDDDDKENEE